MNKYFGVFVIVAFLVVGSILVYSKNNIKSKNEKDQGQILSEFDFNPQKPKNSPSPTPSIVKKPMEEVNELKIEEIKVGDGAEVKSGDTVEVNYIGTLLDGAKFDSSYDRRQTFTTKIGAGEVIEGWDKGIPGMKVGGKRKLTIPYQMAYGDQGNPPVIPPKSPLIFEVEVISIK